MKGDMTLEINGYKCSILRYTYGFSREIHENGLPKSYIGGGNIYVEMEAGEQTDILEVMLSKKMRTETYSGVEYQEPFPCSGKIRCVDDDESIIRELKFDEAYLYRYGERFDAEGKMPLTAWLSISTVRLDINRNLQLDRRWDTTGGVWCEKEVEDLVAEKVVSYSPPTPRITSVEGENTTWPFQKIKYTVTGYNVENVDEHTRKEVKWMLQINGKEEALTQKGETLDLLIKGEWIGKEIIVMPYLRTHTPDVSVRTEVPSWRVPRMFTRSQNWAGKTADGKTAEDMLCGDKTPEEVLKINELFEHQLKTSNHELFKDLIYLTQIFTLADGREHGMKMVEHFKGNSGATYSSEYMDQALAKHETLKAFIYNKNGIVEVLNAKLKKLNGDFNQIKPELGILESTRPKFNTREDYLNGMKITVDGIAAFIVYIDDFKLVSPESYDATIRIEIYDHYGLDRNDVEKFGFAAGFRSWYVLQHVRGYKPFLTKMKYVFQIKNQNFSKSK